MDGDELNLTELSEEELRHISEVLHRDKKLQEQSKLSRVTLNNNNSESDKQKHVTANDLVTAEIDRVKRLTPSSGQSGRSTPLRATSETGSVTPTDEGFFKSFAGMICRTLHGTDSSNTNTEMSTLRALAGATLKLNSIPKVPFNYNHRESMKRKPTLLELSSVESNSVNRSSTSPRTQSKASSAMAQYRRSRGNARFFSSPDSTFSSLPRNYHHKGASPIIIPVPLRSRSPSLQETRSRSISPVFAAYQINPRSQKSTVPSLTRTSPQLHSRHGSTAIPMKYGSRRSSSIEEPLRFFPSPDARESPDGEYTQTPAEINVNKCREGMQLRKTKQDALAKMGVSCDSGIYSKSDDLMKSLNSDGMLDDNISLSRLNVHGYESEESPSVSEFDLYTPWITRDNGSLISASSLNSSPIRRVVSDEGPNERHTNRYQTETLSLRKSPSGLLCEPDSNTLDDRQFRKRHLRNISAGSAITLAMSASGSPDLSHRSLTLPTRHYAKRDSLISSKCEDANVVGNLEISVVYYSSDDLKRKKMTKMEIPRNGTKSSVVPDCNVLSRKEYSDVTYSNLILDHSSRSGCPESLYGELHITIKGAKFQDPAGKIKAPTSYVKCYLLPDKFHNSKMKTAVVKKNSEPIWNHTFVLAGFSQSELRERSLEIIVGSIHFKKQEVIGGAILSIGQGGPHRPWIKSTKAEAYIWKTALQISGSKVKAFVPLRANMKPTYL